MAAAALATREAAVSEAAANASKTCHLDLTPQSLTVAAVTTTTTVTTTVTPKCPENQKVETMTAAP